MRGHRALAIAACSAAAVLWSQLALARLGAVHHHTFDLAEYARLAWGLAHGQPWDAIMGGNVLGGHMPWVLAPLGVVGAAWSALWGDGLGTVKTLLVAQAFALAFSGYPLFRIAARWLGSNAAVLLVIAYLAYPTLGHVATYEMHPGSLSLLPIAFALDAIDARLPRQLAIACACMLLCRASLGLEVMALGALAWLAARDDAREAAAVAGNPRRAAAFSHVPALRKAGISVAVLGFGYLALSMLVLRPSFGATAAAPGSMDLHFGPWGGSPFGIALALFTRPGDVLAHLATAARLNYVPMLLAPWAFIPLLAPRTLLAALPVIAINLASVFPTTTRIDSHYLSTAVPVLCASAIYGAHRLGRDGLRLLGHEAPRWQALHPIAFAMTAVAALANATAGGMPWSLDYAAADFNADARTRAARMVLGQIPPGVSVQAPDALLPHLAERTAVHRVPPPDRNTDLVVLDLSHRAQYARREDLVRTQQEPLARSWLARPDLAVLAFADPYVLLARGHNPRAGYVRRYFVARERVKAASTDVRLSRCVALRSVVIEPRTVGTPDAVAREPFMLVLTLRPDGTCPSDLALRFGMPPKRVDLPCDGLLSPAHWRAGDLIRSRHPLSDRELTQIERYGLWLGVLRSSGARPEPGDPIAENVAVPARP